MNLNVKNVIFLLQNILGYYLIDENKDALT